MASVNDWAAKAARYIFTHRDVQLSQERIAAIISTYAEPLEKLLRESRRSHYHCEDSWYCCGKCTHDCLNNHDDGIEHDDDCYVSSLNEPGGMKRTSGVCNCGADAWNARVDAALDGKE